MNYKFEKEKLLRRPLFMVALICSLEIIYVFLWMIQNSLLFLPGLILIVLCGHEIRRGFMEESDKYKLPWFFGLAVNSALGIMSIILITILLTVSYTFSEMTLRLVFLGITLGISLVATLKVEYWRKKGQPTENLTPKILLLNGGNWTNVLAIASMVIGFLIMVYVRSKEPFPTFAGLDHFHYMPWIYKLLEEKGLESLFLQGGAGALSMIAQPFGYAISIGAFLIILNIDFLHLFFYGPFLTFPLYAILIFTFGLKLFRNEWISFLGVLLGITIAGQGHFYGAQDLYSTSITQLLFLIIWLYFYIIHDKFGVKEFLSAGLIHFLFFLIYPFTAIMNLPLIALYIKDRKKRKYLFFIAVLIIAVGTIYSQWSFFTNWSFLNQLHARWILISISYSWLHLGLGMAGIVLLAFPFIRKRIHDNFFIPMVFYSIVLIVLYWSGLPQYTQRFEWYWRTFYVLVAAIPLLGLTAIKSHHIRRQIISVVMAFIVISQGTIYLIKGMSSPWLITRPIYSLHNDQKFMGGAISKEELLAMKWLEKNTTPNDYIITDPYMGNLLRGTINRQASSALVHSSGEIPSPNSPRYGDLRIMNYKFLDSFRSSEKYINITLGKSIISNVPEDEKYSLEAGHGAEKLIDGNNIKYAYPASSTLDYTVDLGDYFSIDRINIIWGEFGSRADDGKSYIDQWSVDGKTDQGWTKIASGFIPNSSSTKIATEGQLVNMLRIRTSGDNWSGIYEFSAEMLYDLSSETQLSLAHLKNEIKSDLQKIKPGLILRYIFISPRMTYWLQHNQLQNEDGTVNEALDKLGNWPINVTEVDPWDYEYFAKNLNWKISYQKGDIIIVEIP